MNTIKTVMVAAGICFLAACAQNNSTSVTATSNKQHFQCGSSQVIFAQTQTGSVLTMSQVRQGNVEAKTVALQKNGSAYENTQEQIRWVSNAQGAELTYPVDGIVQYFPCQAQR
ncbi:MAG: hypothetical protein J6V99_04180 [Neisseriaceae bacterium]|nr:hypothetical protein [Neisseriaceae bacterium]